MKSIAATLFLSLMMSSVDVFGFSVGKMVSTTNLPYHFPRTSFPDWGNNLHICTVVLPLVIAAGYNDQIHGDSWNRRRREWRHRTTSSFQRQWRVLWRWQRPQCWCVREFYFRRHHARRSTFVTLRRWLKDQDLRITQVYFTNIIIISLILHMPY